MKSVTGKFKIWLVITLVVIVAGMAILGVFGLNQSVDMDSACEVEVSIDVNIDNASETLKSASEKYFADNGMNVANYATQTLGDGEKVIFRFYDLDEINITDMKSGLKTTVESALVDKGLGGLEVTVNAYESQGYAYKPIGYTVLAFGLAALAIFVYYAFMEKISGALTVICSSAISAVLYIALASLARIPADSYFGACVAFAAVFAGVLSGGIVNRCGELIRNVGNDKKSYFEIGDIATNLSVTRFVFLSIALLIVCAVLAILGSVMVKFIAAQLAIAGIASLFVAYVWTAILWATFKDFKKDKKYQAAEKE